MTAYSENIGADIKKIGTHNDIMTGDKSTMECNNEKIDRATIFSTLTPKKPVMKGYYWM